ncbi:MAG: hypothetical protein ISS33_01015 [Candidatus Omnitrophica bacterium]|nr:hypothetical protein [Candidatus Omnitrophota bacterium]
MDRTILNLLTLLITGAGIFAILIKYDVPQLSYAFFDENPYAIKRDVISKILTSTFIGLASLGLFLQAYGMIIGNKLNERVYDYSFYTKFFLVGIVGMFVFVVTLGAIGRCIAKKTWWPKIIQSQSEAFKMAGDIIRNKGFYNKELDKIEKFSDEQKEELPIQRYQQCDKYLTQIEDLLEIRNIPKIREERYRKLEKYFKE